jgi:exodeoxyribonuclease V alpha subunit
VSAIEPLVEVDAFEATRARRAPGLLRTFNEAGILAAADVHVALRLGALGGEDDEAVLLAVALAVRGPRLGHVLVDLSEIRESAARDADDEVDVATLPWPDRAAWPALVAASPLVTTGDPSTSRPGGPALGPSAARPGGPAPGPSASRPEGPAFAPRPLRLVGSRLYLDRYWEEERQVAEDLRGFASAEPEGVDVALLRDGLERVFPTGGPLATQRLAAASAVLRRFAVVAGGPGTGKTTTVARILGLLGEQAAAAGGPPPLVALAAPTAKAAARLTEAVREEGAEMDVSEQARDLLRGLQASTLHRLLGWKPKTRSRFRHDRRNRLAYDVVVVDEASMVALSMMGRLLEAVRPDARLILVGDPGQLKSIQVGEVLGDIVGPALDGLLLRPEARERLSAAAGAEVVAREPPGGTGFGDGIVVLDYVHRHGEGIAGLAAAVRRGHADGVMRALGEGRQGVTWIDADAADPAAEAALAPVRDGAVATARAVVEAARAGDGGAAIAALGGFRVLCAHRRGEHGVSAWTARIEGWLEEAIGGFGAGERWYVGRPLLVTENDYSLRLFNGDTGVVVAAGGGRVTAAFERNGEVVHLHPSRLAAVDTVHAMTVHKSQGSQFGTAAVLLPEPTSQILSRELLYTAITRAQRELVLAGTEEAIRAAVERPVARASGLRDRLWSG